MTRETIYEYSQEQTACWPVARVNKLNKPHDSKEGDSEETRHLLLAARENKKKKENDNKYLSKSGR